MVLFSEVNIVPLNRRQRQFWTKLAAFTTFWIMLALYNGGFVHVQNGPQHLHVGVGAVHSEGNEVHLGVSGAWSERLRGPLDAEDAQVIKALRKYYLKPPSSSAYNLNQYKNRLEYKDIDSWKFLHQRIVKLFNDRPPGFFIEAGALDGEYLSNTLHLEKEYGWSGLLVEPHPSSYNELLKKNRRSWSSNTCIAVTPYPKEMLLEMVDTSENAATSQAKWVLRGGSFLQEIGGQDQRYQANHFDTTYTLVQCFPFVTYLRALNITKVDLLSLDVEGAEEHILNTIPWDDVEISVMLLEHHGSSKDKDVKFTQRIKDLGYTLYDYNIDKDNIGDYIFLSSHFVTD